MASVSFRPFNANIWRAALAGLVCLAFAGAARAGDDGQRIEFVPFHNSSLDTNFDKPAQGDQQFKAWEPTAPDSVTPVGRPNRMANMPRSQQNLSKKEQQLQDRRRNWVFATPEDESADKKEKSLLGLDNDDDNMTAMERYYYRLEKSSRPVATNGMSALSPNSFGSQTNSFGIGMRSTDPGSFGETPFKATAPDPGIFQQPGGNDISLNAFGNNSRPTLSSEELRIQTEQKARRESFKQLWNIDQAPAAATVIAPPSSGPVDSSPLFGFSPPGGDAPSKAKPLLGGPTSANNASPPPEPAPYVAPRATAPPEATFIRPQRPF